MRWLWGEREERTFTCYMWGEEVSRVQGLLKTIRKFFKQLYTQPRAPIISLPADLLSKISVEEANMIERIPSFEEIKEALWSCEATKSPGYDGFNFTFY